MRKGRLDYWGDFLPVGFVGFIEVLFVVVVV